MPIKCPKCPKIVKGEQQLAMHLSWKHGIIKKKNKEIFNKELDKVRNMDTDKLKEKAEEELDDADVFG